MRPLPAAAAEAVPGAPAGAAAEGRQILLGGRVQGVGFRPFVARLAARWQLRGDVCNLGALVRIRVWGQAPQLEGFAQALLGEAPALARPQPLGTTPWLPPAPPAAGFCILDSRAGPLAMPQLPPDLSLCDDCRREWQDPADRRHHHAFINCTQCGPRYTVVRDLPYDRASTSMAGFRMCAACAAEYRDPAGRRFHAEPIACPDCGPRLRFALRAADAGADAGPGDAQALASCVAALRRGEIVAVQGIGGYHLMVDACADGAVRRLRQRKGRPHKPLAVMYPWRGDDGLAALRQDLAPDAQECRALADRVRPIVPVRARPGAALAAGIAPGLAEVGAFLPYSPLHLLLLDAFGGPLVATSGNLSGEPVLTDPEDARVRLAAVADAFLHHDRAILRPADDSVVRVIAGHARPLRVGRGLAPLEGHLARPVREATLAFGGESKLTLALAQGTRIVLSPHIGDLSSPRGRAVFAQLVADFQRLHGLQARRWVVDAHPGYASTRWAAAHAPAQSATLLQVPHHHAHAACVAAEHPEVQRWLALTWDGVGLGADGALWGGEALVGAPGHWQRVGSWRRFRPPGAERAAREPWRSAAALAWEAGMPCSFAAVGPQALQLARQAWERGLNAPATSAVGRLLDAAAAWILGLTHSSHEAQGPMQLEALLDRHGIAADGAVPAAAPAVAAIRLPMQPDARGVLRIDWAPLLPLLRDAALDPAERALVLHESIALAAAEQVLRLRPDHAFDAVALGGGVFQNRWLGERLLQLLGAAGVPAWLARELPSNDGGLAWGQVVESAAME